MTTVREQIKIIQAYERGEEIEYKLPSSEWKTLASKEKFIKETGWEYKFNFFNIEYRIKKKRWRARLGVEYFYIDIDGEVLKSVEDFGDMDERCYLCGNYFRTVKQAKKRKS